MPMHSAGNYKKTSETSMHRFKAGDYVMFKPDAEKEDWVSGYFIRHGMDKNKVYKVLHVDDNHVGLLTPGKQIYLFGSIEYCFGYSAKHFISVTSMYYEKC